MIGAAPSASAAVSGNTNSMGGRRKTLSVAALPIIMQVTIDAGCERGDDFDGGRV